MLDAIWDVALGGLTDGEPMFSAFGNPTRNIGRFRETHGSLVDQCSLGRGLTAAKAVSDDYLLAE